MDLIQLNKKILKNIEKCMVVFYINRIFSVTRDLEKCKLQYQKYFKVVIKLPYNHRIKCNKLQSLLKQANYKVFNYIKISSQDGMQLEKLIFSIFMEEFNNLLLKISK